MRTFNKDKICLVKDCTRNPVGRGWCGKHYQRWANTGSPVKVLKEEPNRGLFLLRCRIEDCSEKPHGRGLCMAHYKAWHRSDCPEYEIWQYAKHRCYSPTFRYYANYGGRGIKMCDRWLTNFQAFYEDMGERPSPQHSLDRIDVNGDYSPENCRWATVLEQANNKRNNVNIAYLGRTLTASEWSRETGIKATTIRRRVQRDGWTPERALTYGTK